MGDCHSCGGSLTRRQCLRLFSAAAVGGLLGEDALAATDDERIDPLSLRPNPKVRVSAAILRLPPPYWLGWPGTTYDLEGHQKEYLGKLAQSGRALGIDLDVAASPVQDETALAALMAEAKDAPPDGLLVILQHMACWDWVNRIAQQVSVPLIVFSPVGTSFTGHVLGISRQTGVHVVSSLEWPAVEDGLRMVRAKRRFEESRILWIHADQRNETVLDRLGTRVRAVPRRTFNEAFDRLGVTREVREVAALMRRHARRVVEPKQADLHNSARAYVTAKRLLQAEQANALSMDCLGMVGAKIVPTPPCMAWTLLQDVGITAGCEADLFGAVSLMLTSYLLDRPGYMNDPVAETAKNLLIASHCTCGTRLRGFDKPPVPYVLRNHSESALGVSVQVLWPEGEPATLVRFEGPGEVIVDTGKVVSNVGTPPAGGCRTSVELLMDHIEDARDVRGFHQVVVLGNHRRVVEGFCQLYGIRATRTPQRAPEPERG